MHRLRKVCGIDMCKNKLPITEHLQIFTASDVIDPTELIALV